MSKFFTFFSLFTFFCLINACKIPYDDVDFNVKLTPEYAVPLVQTNMNMGDLFERFDGSSYLKIQANGRLMMSYKSRVLETPPFNLFATLPDVQTFPITEQNTVISFPSPNDTRIDAIDFKKGFLKWRFDAQSTSLNVNISIPQLTKNGQMFRANFILSDTPYRDSIDLNGWTCTPTQDNIVISYVAKTASGETVSLNFQGAYEITRFEYKTVKGYFGQLFIPLPKDSLGFDFFQLWKKNGKILFTEPTITVNFENSMGVQTRIVTSTAETVNQAGERYALQSPLTLGVNINNPTFGQIGTFQKTAVTIDNKNSNLTTLVSTAPILFSQSIVALINIGNTSKVAGFLNDDSRLRVSFGVDIPFVGTAENFVVYDTLALDLAKFSEVANAEFKITTDNGLPIDMKIQGYFINSTGSIIDSLVQKEPLILRGAPTTSAGTTIGTSLAYNFVKMDAAKFTNIRSAKKVIVKYTVSSTNNGANPVIVNSSQNFGLKLG